MGVEPTGETVELQGTIFAHITDGKITERWLVDDIYGFLTQLGKISRSSRASPDVISAVAPVVDHLVPCVGGE